MTSKEKLNAKAKKYRDLHPLKVKESYKKWMDKHPGHHKNYYLKHKEEHDENMAAWYKDNKELHHEKVKQWKKNNPDVANEIDKRSKNLRKRKLGFQPLNNYFLGSNGHHIDTKNVIYIPDNLHKSVSHKQSNPASMNKINILAWTYMESEVY